LLETTYPQPMYEIKTNKKKDASCLKQAKKVPYMLKWPLKKEAKNKDVATCFQHCKQHTNAKGTPWTNLEKLDAWCNKTKLETKIEVPFYLQLCKETNIAKQSMETLQIWKKRTRMMFPSIFNIAKKKIIWQGPWQVHLEKFCIWWNKIEAKNLWRT